MSRPEAPSFRSNTIRLAENHRDFRLPGLRYSVSSRLIAPGLDLMAYLRMVFMYLSTDQIESVFGHTCESSPLYGGRVYSANNALTPRHLEAMRKAGIGLSLTLTNHFFDEDAWHSSSSLLERHHRPGNSVICVNDQLAKRIRAEFPDYTVKASIIKNLTTRKSVERALEEYALVTVPMDRNDDDSFLESLPEKHRIILFANANCAYTCPRRTCYSSFSKRNRGEGEKSHCSKAEIPRLEIGNVYFNVRKFREMGFTNLKLVPLAPVEALKAAAMASPQERVEPREDWHYFCSFPKSGRTWIRFVLAHYLALVFDPGMEVNFDSVFWLVPNAEDAPPPSALPSSIPFPEVRFSHETYDPTRRPPDRTIFMWRSIPDTLVSGYFHAHRFLRVFDGSLTEFLRSKSRGLPALCRYLNGWANHVRDGGPAIRYEDMHADAKGVVRRVLAWLRLPVNDQWIDEAIRRSSFENLLQSELRAGGKIAGQEYSLADPEARRIRIGKIGSGLSYLSSADLDWIRATAGQLLTDQTKDVFGPKDLGIAE